MVTVTADVSEHIQMVFVLRYLSIKELFWGILYSKIHIRNCILEKLDIILQGNGQKLIAQRFYNANVLKGRNRSSSKNKIRISNAHQLHLMRNVVNITRNARIYFL